MQENYEKANEVTKQIADVDEQYHGGENHQVDIYSCNVRCGVPGNPNASQRIYGLTLDKGTGEVTEENIILHEISTYNLW